MAEAGKESKSGLDESGDDGHAGLDMLADAAAQAKAEEKRLVQNRNAAKKMRDEHKEYIDKLRKKLVREPGKGSVNEVLAETYAEFCAMKEALEEISKQVKPGQKFYEVSKWETRIKLKN